MGAEHIILVENPAHISVDLKRLRIRRPKHEDSFFDVFDVHAIILDHDEITISHNALRRMADSGTTLVITDEQHLPCAQILSDNSNTRTASRARLQIKHEGDAFSNNLWRSIVETRLLTEAMNLRRLNMNGALHLERLSADVMPGDKTNVEATAARYYWRRLFEDFLRIKQGAADPINTRLNYGYAVLRAMVAKEIVAAGLHPGIGLKHSNATNVLNLADDLMEPFRFVVELHVTELELESEFKGHAKIDVLRFVERHLGWRDELSAPIGDSWACVQLCTGLGRPIGETLAAERLGSRWTRLVRSMAGEWCGYSSPLTARF
jgi:CRISPR-associated protein Cas1